MFRHPADVCEDRRSVCGPVAQQAPLSSSSSEQQKTETREYESPQP